MSFICSLAVGFPFFFWAEILEEVLYSSDPIVNTSSAIVLCLFLPETFSLLTRVVTCVCLCSVEHVHYLLPKPSLPVTVFVPHFLRIHSPSLLCPRLLWALLPLSIPEVLEKNSQWKLGSLLCSNCLPTSHSFSYLEWMLPPPPLLLPAKSSQFCSLHGYHIHSFLWIYTVQTFIITHSDYCEIFIPGFPGASFALTNSVSITTWITIKKYTWCNILKFWSIIFV